MFRSAQGRIAQPRYSSGPLIPDARCLIVVMQNKWGVLDVVAKFSSPRIELGSKI
jgi:hypothetical protein